MKNLINLGLISLACLLISTTVFAQQKISIQGILKDGDGAAVEDGNYDLSFTLYNHLTAGSQVWTETQSSVAVRGGIYSVLLGSVNGFNVSPHSAVFDVPYFLGVKVNNGTELTPRTELSYAPYALAVDNTAKVGGLYVHTGVNNEANKVVRTDGNGYIMARHINVADGYAENQNSSPARVWGSGDNGDGFLRSYRTSALGVATATNAGTSAALRSGTAPNHAMTFHWSAIGGQPQYYWGGNQGVNMNIYETGQLSVNYANSAGSANSLNAANHYQINSLRTTGNTPDYAPYVVNQASSYWHIGGGAGAGGLHPFNNGFGIVTNSNLGAVHYFAFSDERIKKNIEPSDYLSDLAILNKLEVVDYEYKDVPARGDGVHKGFIAQQVREVFPEAVSLDKRVVPDVYTNASMVTHANGRTTISIEQEHDLKVGDNIRLLFESGDELLTILDCPNNNQFMVEGLSPDVSELFVFGREVDDFHTVDYDRIYSIGISVIQELVKQIADLEEENKSLKEQQTDHVKGMSLLSDRMNALELRLNHKSQSSMTTSEE